MAGTSSVMVACALVDCCCSRRSQSLLKYSQHLFKEVSTYSNDSRDKIHVMEAFNDEEDLPR